MNDDRGDLTRQLPDPAPELPEHRHQLLRERFMQQIEATPAVVTALPRRPRRRLVLALSAGIMALMVAAGSVSAFGLGVGKFWADRTAAGALLERIALVAGSSTDIPPVDQIRDDQFAFVETYGGYVGPVYDRGYIRLEPMEMGRRQIWLSIDGTRPGLLHDSRFPAEETVIEHGEAYLNNPTFRYLTTLPTNPDVLLAKIYLETFGAGSGPQQEAFVTIGDLMRESIVPPDLAEALYRAAARIPGVTVVEDAVDALGRHGVAIAREDGGTRTEWIFDRTTLEFLGERTLIPGGPDDGSAGTVTGSTAVVVRAIVDQAGQLPG